MTPKEWACLAQDAYTVAPNLGPENSAGRVIFNTTADGLVLSIPGTNNIACAEADADALIHDTGALGCVHKGIWDAFDPVWTDVAKLNAYAIVGHSEGAAGTIYLAARLCLIGKAPRIVWAWEPPRTSIDDKLAQVIAAAGVELHIMWHGNDIVPGLPLELPFLGWRHAGPVTRFGNASEPFPNVHDHLLQNIIPELA
jgi:triacylglycerol lipase